ncbi:MAG: bifunctional 4-hydroxy-2-oxoglutarate aldolase/2-dehydro-3-deoxy-phosphogluconate aldolase [Eubacteriales bacterium]
MNQEELIQLVLTEKVIAIARGIEPEHAVKTAQALYEGGIRIMEFPFDMKNPDSTKADQCIEAVAKAMAGKMYVGCGTASSVNLVERAAKSGASFIISANVNVDVIKKTKELGLISMPGVFTATEAMTAVEAGADFVKIFPAGNVGTGYIKALCGPFGHIRYLAVGGVDEKNTSDFLKAGCVGVGIGGNLVNNAWISSGEFDKITELAKKYVDAAKSIN